MNVRGGFRSRPRVTMIVAAWGYLRNVTHRFTILEMYDASYDWEMKRLYQRYCPHLPEWRNVQPTFTYCDACDKSLGVTKR